jgi:uncharacterized RDD family membrane protein YckC
LLDALLNLCCLIPAAILVLAVEREETDEILLFLAVAGVVYMGLWIYQAWLRATQGQTIGKKAAKVRIVSYDDGSNPGFWRAVFLRDLVPWLIGFFLPYGIFAVIDNSFIFGRERRCVHDYMAGTIVVRADVPPGLDAAEVFD